MPPGASVGLPFYQRIRPLWRITCAAFFNASIWGRRRYLTAVRVVRTFGMVGLMACSLSGQSPPPRPTFEVASIKTKAASEAGPADFVPRRSGDRVSIHNTQLELVVPYAYHVPRGYPVEGDLSAPE